MSIPALRRRASLVLAAFVAAVCATVLAPMLHPVAYELLCSANGSRLVVTDDSHEVVGATLPDPRDDHGAHCPLCLPAGAPSTIASWDFTPVQPLAHRQASIPAARLASLVGAPLPARGPPTPS